MKLANTVIALAFGCALGLAQEPQGPASKPSTDAIKAQVRNLDNDAFEVRTKAMEDLRAAGEAARTDLEAAKKSNSLEVRTRAETLLKDLDDKKSSVRQPGGLVPVGPDEESGRGAARAVPRPQDFQDPEAFGEAIRKWMDERQRGTRFPGWVVPDTKDFTIIGPGQLGGTFSFAQISNGEKMTFKSGADGVTMEVEKKDETGKPVIERFSAKDAEEFKTKYPEVWEKYQPIDGGGLTWRTRSSIPAPGPIEQLTQPKLGVLTSTVPPVLDKQLKLKGEGVVIDSVYPETLASRLGIHELDVLVQLDGEVVRDKDDILRLLARKTPPPTATARVVREGVILELSTQREKPR